jgi:DNA-binding transcriptional ArsR family regulator
MHARRERMVQATSKRPERRTNYTRAVIANRSELNLSSPEISSPEISSPEISSIAALIGEPARAAMLTALMGGVALPAGELAELAGVSPQTASTHLQKLLEGALLAVETQGRHRYYRLANADVAQALEALMILASGRNRHREHPDDLCYARTCYDHLAGTLGVQVCQTMLEAGWLERTANEFVLTALGGTRLVAFGVALPNRITARACLDWTERQHHLGGSLGRALTARLLERRWVARMPNTRALRLTEPGRAGLIREFGLRL